MKRAVFVVFIVFYCVLSSEAQQDRQFSSGFFNQVTQNPAFVGATNKWNVGGVLREQWSSLDGSPSTSVFSLDMPFRVLNTYHGLGISFISDKLGANLKQSTTSVAISYSYKYKLLGGVLSIGARAAYINYSLDGKGNLASGTTWNNNKKLLEGTEGTEAYDELVGVVDYSGGLLYKKDSWYVGLSVNHLLEPNLFSKSVDGDNARTIEIDYNRNFYMTGGYAFDVSPSFILTPTIHAISDLSSYQFTGGVRSLINNVFWLGVAYRQDDAILLNTGIQFKGGMKFGYSYDYGISEFSRTSNGSHELMVVYSFDVKAKRQKMSSVRFL